jgi:hypothetical protein
MLTKAMNQKESIAFIKFKEGYIRFWILMVFNILITIDVYVVV